MPIATLCRALKKKVEDTIQHASTGRPDAAAQGQLVSERRACTSSLRVDVVIVYSMGRTGSNGFVGTSRLTSGKLEQAQSQIRTI